MNEKDLKSQAEFVLADIDALSRSLSGDTVDASVSRLHSLRQSIDEMGMSAAPAMVPQTTPKAARGQQSAPPSRLVKPSDEPPTEEQIAAMENALEFTHLPGPPMKEIGQAGGDGPRLPGVREITTDAMVFVDQAEEALGEDDLDAARAALARAKEAIDELYASMP
jgi:hypothetical protein